jgi:hypothetical protein
MPTQGQSLVGFMADQQEAINYLGSSCVPPDPAPAALLAQWTAAQAQLGAPFPNAGQPIVEEIPPDHDAHVQAVQAAPWMAPVFLEGWQLRLVTIEPLLAFQFHVDIDRVHSLCAALPNPAGLADVMDLCLPLNPQPPLVRWVHQPQSVTITSPSLNIRIGNKGVFPGAGIAGAQFAFSLPCVQVVRCNGRSYLRNGFHRAFGIFQNQLTRMPCLYKEVATFAEVGAEGQGMTFGQPLLESVNPPIFAHFTQGRSSAVLLRRCSRLIHVS